jgi:hypothetical protein
VVWGPIPVGVIGTQKKGGVVGADLSLYKGTWTLQDSEYAISASCISFFVAILDTLLQD